VDYLLKKGDEGLTDEDTKFYKSNAPTILEEHNRYTQNLLRGFEYKGEVVKPKEVVEPEVLGKKLTEVETL